MPPLNVGSPAIRIYQGETIAGQGWGNAAFQLSGQFRIVYDDGTDDVFTIDRTALDATRKRTGLPSKRVAKMDGWVNSGSVWQVAGANNTSAAQRGACYVQMGILAGAPGDSTGIFPEIRIQLARGYCYLGHPVALGENVEPGPTGGSGHIREISVTSTAVGGSAGLVLAAVPTNAMWLWIAGTGVYLATGTVGSRNVRYRFRDNAGNNFLRSNASNPIASQQDDYEFALNQTILQTISLGGAIAVEFESPARTLPAAYDLFVVDTANIDVLDTITMEAAVEEWVIPGV